MIYVSSSRIALPHPTRSATHLPYLFYFSIHLVFQIRIIKRDHLPISLFSPDHNRNLHATFTPDLNVPVKCSRLSLHLLFIIMTSSNELPINHMISNDESSLGTTKIIKVKTGSYTHESKNINLENISGKELKTIREKDSFLYFSIPELRSAEVLGNEVDSLSTLVSPELAGRSSTGSMQRPSLQATKPLVVTRRRRITFECHPYLLLNEFLNEDSSEHQENDSPEDR